MQLLIDARLTSASDIPFLHYALLWADVWKIYHPHDEVIFLAHEDDPHIPHECIRVKKTWHHFSRKKLASHSYGPERVVSFSKLPPYDTNIKQISHMGDISPLLYPTKPLRGFEYKWKLHEYKKVLSQSHSIIIPHRDTLTTLNELFTLEDEKITVIPYLHPLGEEVYKIRTILPHGIFGDYFIAEGTEGLEWRPLELIETYATYIHRMGGKEKLIILGDVGDNLGAMTSMIRTFDLLDSIKIIGILSREERELLYNHAIGWIYAGPYYSRGPSVGLASGYDVPLFFTDISGLRDYSGIYFHPNHLERLPELLRTEKNKYQIQVKANNEAIMQVYTRIINE